MQLLNPCRQKAARMNLASSKYFFLNGTLHKLLKHNKHKDFIVAHDYGDGKRKNYIASDVLKKKEPAFNAGAIAKIIGRARRVVRQWKKKGLTPPPHVAYSLENPEHVVDIFWTAEQAWELWEYASSIHIGRPRKDGEVTPKSPPKIEAKAMIEGGRIMYYQDEDGEFQPTWRALD